MSTVLPANIRTKEQVLFDLSKALCFSASALEQNRKGRLAPEQWRGALLECIRPLGTGLACILGPLLFFSIMLAGAGHGFSGSLHALFDKISHPGDIFDEFGIIKSSGAIGISIGGIVAGLFFLTRISPALYFDVVERSVLIREGRVGAREQETFRPDGKDPIELYYFDFKSEMFPVNREAFLALDNGAAYFLYLLPRSRRLVAIEPKISE